MIATLHPGRIAKAEWAARLAVSRQIALNDSNIKSGWKETGLVPFNPDKLLALPQRVTTPPPQRQLSRTPLASISSENCNFIRDNYTSLGTPVKNRLFTMADQLEGLTAENGVLKRENEELRVAARKSKRARAGFTVKNEGTHLFSTEDMLRKAAERKTEIAAKKARPKPRKGAQGSQDAREATAGPSTTST